MAVEDGQGAGTTSSRIDGHRLSEFVYGTVTGMVAVAGVSGDPNMSWLNAASIILVGALAIWIAHAYSHLLSKRVVSGHRLARHDITETLANSWLIVTAGILLALPLLPAAIGLWPVDVALRLASLTGICILALVGILAGIVTKETWPRRILLAALSAGLGLAIAALEFIVRH